MTELQKRAAQMAWDPPAGGTEARLKMPRSAFLLPASRKYPYKVYIDGQWVISIKGLRAAISVANFQGQTNVANRASAVLAKLQEGSEAEHSLTHGAIFVENFLQHYGSTTLGR